MVWPTLMLPQTSPILIQTLFNPALLAADYDAILRAHAVGKRFKPVDCVIAPPPTVEVSLALNTEGLVAPIGLTYNLSATSQVPVASP